MIKPSIRQVLCFVNASAVDGICSINLKDEIDTFIKWISEIDLDKIDQYDYTMKTFIQPNLHTHST